MLKSYFEIIRLALSQKRKKRDGIYYESHHIVPKSFDKNSTTVLLTPEEHYKAHRDLAEAFTGHTLYGQKMLWAFHRMTYNNGRQITEQEYAEARRLLMPLWKRKKSEKWKEKMRSSMKGNKNGVGGKDNWVPTEQQRQRYSEAAIKRQTGKVGEHANASKGIVICENIETGETVEAGSAFQLSKKLENIHYSVLHEALNGSDYTNYKPRSKSSKYYNFLQTHKIYYK